MAHGTDPYRDLYSRRAATMIGSPIRALFVVTQRPEIISFAGGLPFTEALPADRIADFAREVLERDSAAALQYGSALGIPALKETLCACMAREGIEAGPHELVVTDGAQQALELLGKIFLDPGDVVLTEGPTYVGALQAFGSFQPDIRAVELDDDGLVPEALQDALARLRSEGRRPKFLYLVPTFQNPSGVTLAQRRRGRILEICQSADLLIVEDNPYALVRFEGTPVTPLRCLAPDSVIYLGTLSKVFAPGVRIGWVLAPEQVRDRIVLAKEAADLCTSPFTQMLADVYMRSAQSTTDLDLLTKIYKDRRDTMLDAMDRYFPPEARTRLPEGGLFLWVSIDAPIDTDAMLARALGEGVAYISGTGFFPDGRGRDAMRLNFSYPAPEQIEEGMRRLGGVITEEVELARSMGS
jgi:DNA-binding transcriptional MocR family regulator